MHFCDSDTDPVYSFVHADDIVVVDTTFGNEELRKIIGDDFLVPDTGSLNHDGLKLGFPGRILIRMGYEVHLDNSKGYSDGRLEILRRSRANGSEAIGAAATKVTLDVGNSLTPEELVVSNKCR